MTLSSLRPSTPWMWWAVGLLSGFTMAPELSGQSSDRPVQGAVRVLAGATTVTEEVTSFWGLGAHLRLGGITLGGAGYVVSTADFTAEGQNRLSVGLGYGGLEVEAPLPWSPTPSLRVGVLLGGGNAEVVEAGVGRELGADNFVVFEPRISLVRDLADVVDGSISLGYRSVLGVDDLPGIAPLSLSSLSVSLNVSVPRYRRR